VLQCVAVYCSVLQCVAVCCSVSAPCFSATPAHTGSCVVFMCCSVLQSVAVCCSVLQYAAVCCSVLAPCFAATPAHTGSCVTFMCCSVLQCVAVCCSVQCFGSLFSSRACAYAGRRTKFAPMKSLDSSEFSSEFSDLKTLTSNVKVNPVISWNGRNSFHRIFPSNSQDFTTPQISFEFSGFYCTSNSFLIQPLLANDRKTCPFREILSQRKGRGEDRVE